MIKEASNKNIRGIFGEKDNYEVFYKIPPYQRSYAWGKENWENLFDDIYENERGYFLGSIICIDRLKSDGYYEVIDGQQRLTTLSILLLAIYNKILELDEKYSDLLNPRKNKSNATQFFDLEKMLVKSDDQLSNIQKLTLSKQDENDKDYTYLLHKMNLIEEEIDQPKYFGNRRIAKAFEHFKKRLEDFSENDNGKEVFRFYDKVASAFMVQILVEDENSAFTLFESINNRGMPLTPIDLIKNSIIRYHKDEAEKTNERWQKVIENVKDYNDQIRFLRHYYHAFYEEVRLDKFPIAKKSNIIKIYTEFIKKDVERILSELINKSDIYNKFIEPDNIEENSEFYKYKAQLTAMKNLGVAPSYALLLHLFSKYPDDNFMDLLNFLENWFIRRNLSDYPNTNKLDNIFLDLIKKIYKEGYSFQLVKDYLIQDKYMLPDDKFKELLLTRPLYEDNKDAVKALLIKLERSKRTKENDSVDWWKKEKGKSIWTIEHILPQNPSNPEDWKVDDSEMKQYLHTLGNLTLTRYNSNLSNKSFKRKIEDNKYGLKSGNVKINDYILKNDLAEWTIEDIKKRGEELVSEIIDLLSL